MERKKGIRKRKRPDIQGIIETPEEKKKVKPIEKETPEEAGEASSQQDFLSKKFLRSWKKSLPEF